MNPEESVGRRLYMLVRELELPVSVREFVDALEPVELIEGAPGVRRVEGELRYSADWL